MATADPNWARLTYIPQVPQQQPSSHTAFASLLKSLAAELILNREDHESILRSPIQYRNELLMSTVMRKPAGTLDKFYSILRKHELDTLVQPIEPDLGSNQQQQDIRLEQTGTGTTQQQQMSEAALRGNASVRCTVPPAINNTRNAIIGSHNQLYEVTIMQQGTQGISLWITETIYVT